MFSFKEGKKNVRMGIHKALYSVYALIQYLITTKEFNLTTALEKANEGYQKIIKQKEEKDEIILENPFKSFLFLFTKGW